jgi:hypothetical protein
MITSNRRLVASAQGIKLRPLIPAFGAWHALVGRAAAVGAAMCSACSCGSRDRCATALGQRSGSSPCRN